MAKCVIRNYAKGRSCVFFGGNVSKIVLEEIRKKKLRKYRGDIWCWKIQNGHFQNASPRGHRVNSMCGFNWYIKNIITVKKCTEWKASRCEIVGLFYSSHIQIRHGLINTFYIHQWTQLNPYNFLTGSQFLWHYLLSSKRSEGRLEYT